MARFYAYIVKRVSNAKLSIRKGDPHSRGVRISSSFLNTKRDQRVYSYTNSNFFPTTTSKNKKEIHESSRNGKICQSFGSFNFSPHLSIRVLLFNLVLKKLLTQYDRKGREKEKKECRGKK